MIMGNLLTFGYRNYRLVLILALLLTISTALLLERLQINVSVDTLISENNPDFQAWQRVTETFGDTESFFIYAEDPHLFSKDRLSRLQQIHNELAALGEVDGIESLFTLANIYDDDGLLDTEPVLASIPSDSASLEQKKQQALNNPLFAESLIGKNGEALLIVVNLNATDPSAFMLRNLHERVEAILEKERSAFTFLFQAGGPATQSWMLDSLQYDLTWILPLGVVVIVFLLMLSMRSPLTGLIPVFNAILATVWTFGFMAFLGIPVNLLNYIVPALILVIGATEDVHIMHEFKEHLILTKNGESALGETGNRILLALILTSLTTVLGFASAILSDLPVLHDFGLAAVIGMSVRFFLSLILLPAILRISEFLLLRSFLTHPVQLRIGKVLPDIIDKWLSPRHRLVLLLVIILAVFGLYLGRNIELDNDLGRFIDRKSEISRQKSLLQGTFSGINQLRLTFYGNGDDFIQPANLQRVSQISEFVESLDGVDSTLNFADVLSRINEQFNEGDPAHYKIPQSTAAIRQMLLFVPDTTYSSLITPDYSTTSIDIRFHLESSSEINNLVETIENELSSNRYGTVVYTLTGKSALLASAVESITKAQVRSLIGMSILLFGIVAALFLSIRCGIITLVSNLIPICLVFGVMALMGISMNVATCMVAAITLGIAIDDTLHLLVRFNRELKIHRDERKGIRETLRAEAEPIIATSIALAAGFAVLQFSSFAPIREFGWLSALVMMLALFTDLVITPLFFGSIRIVTLWDIIGLKLRRQLLTCSPFFEGLSSWQAKRVILASDIREFESGQQIIKAGETGDTMYVVLSGKLEAYLTTRAGHTSLAQFRMGDVFGEMSLISRQKRTAHVRTLSQVRALALNASWLESMRRFSPYLASLLFLNIAKILSDRLTQSNRMTSQPFPDMEKQ